MLIAIWATISIINEHQFTAGKYLHHLRMLDGLAKALSTLVATRNMHDAENMHIAPLAADKRQKQGPSPQVYDTQIPNQTPQLLPVLHYIYTAIWGSETSPGGVLLIGESQNNHL